MGSGDAAEALGRPRGTVACCLDKVARCGLSDTNDTWAEPVLVLDGLPSFTDEQPTRLLCPSTTTGTGKLAATAFNGTPYAGLSALLILAGAALIGVRRLAPTRVAAE